MKLKLALKIGLWVLLAASVAMLVYCFVIGFETSDGQPVDLMLYWAYAMCVAVLAAVVIGLVLRVFSSPKSLIKMGGGLCVFAALAAAAYFLAEGAPAMGMAEQPEAQTLKFTDTLLNLTYICGALAILSIVVGEVRMLISNSKK